MNDIERLMIDIKSASDKTDVDMDIINSVMGIICDYLYSKSECLDDSDGRFYDVNVLYALVSLSMSMIPKHNRDEVMRDISEQIGLVRSDIPTQLIHDEHKSIQ